MSQSGNQGPNWWFAWVGHENSNTGMARFLALPVAYIIVLGTLFWVIWPS
jgi:hypothetical protein